MLAGYASLSLALLAGIPQAFSYEETLVTAQRREQPLLETPLSVSVITNSRLEEQGLLELADLSSPVVNFQVSLPNGPVLPIFTIRGISMVDYSVNQSSPIGINVDEVPLSANYTQGLSLFDIERIEVLRGPQGTLYGKNTTGGTVNVITHSPDFESDGYVTVTVGNYQRKAIDAAVETPLLQDVLAARLAVNADKAGGYTENHYRNDDLSATNNWAARLSLLLKSSDSFDAVLKLSSGRSSPNAQAVIPEATDPGGLDRLASVYASFSLPFYRRPSHYDGFDTDSNRIDQTNVKVDGASLAINWLFDDFTITSITGYYKGDYDHGADADGTPLSLLETSYIAQNTQWTEDLRLTSTGGDPLSYTVGLFFAKDAYDVTNQLEFFHGLQPLVPAFGPLSGFTVGQHYEQERRSQAIYGQTDYELNNDSVLSVGLRYSKDKNQQFNVQTWQGDYSNTPLIGLIPFNLPYDSEATYPRQKITDERASGTLKYAYHIDADHMLYTSYSRGYRSSAFNGAAIFSAAELEPMDAETVSSYELGVKGRESLFELNYRVALFHSRYHNQQFLRVEGPQQILDSARRAKITGIEIEADARITEQWLLYGGLSLMDSEYTDGPVLTAAGQPVDLSGNQLVATPRREASLVSRYNQPLNGNGTLTAILSVNYTGKRYFSAFNDDYGYDGIDQAGFSLWNTRLEYNPPSGQWSLALWGKNITDKEYKTFAINLSDTFGYHYTTIGAPRTYGVELQMKF